jgi:hypothetical protein
MGFVDGLSKGMFEDWPVLNTVAREKIGRQARTRERALSRTLANEP